MADKFIPQEALEYIRKKDLKFGFSYKDVWNEEHATSFTVAKAMQIDVLDDIKNSVEKAIENGETFETFKKNLKPTLQKKGWWGRKTMTDPLTGDLIDAQLGSDRRLRTIYDVNLRSAYQKGQYERTMQSDMHPYLMYRIGNSIKHRDSHYSWDGLVLPKDDPFWNTHFPPNGWGCKCYTRAITEKKKRKYEEKGIRIPPTVDGKKEGILKIKTKAPKDEFYTFFNERKGTVERIPKGISPGFAWNQARDEMGFQNLIDKARSKAPQQVKDLAETYLTSKIHNKQFQNFIKKAYDGKLNGDFTSPVGFIDKDVRLWLLKNKGIDIGDSNIITLEARLFAPGNPKADRHSKILNNAVGKSGASILIEALFYGRTYFDKNSNNLIYLFTHSQNQLIKVTVSTGTKLKYKKLTFNTPCVRNLQTINASKKDGEFIRITQKLERIR